MFKLKKGRAAFAPVVAEEKLLTFFDDILADRIYGLPLSELLVKYFRQFIYPDNGISANLKLGFAFWDNDSKRQVARLVAADGFSYQSSEYPKELSYGEGIAGRILEEYRKGIIKGAYVSRDYDDDPYLAAAEVIKKKFKFKAGLALPVVLHGNLLGIFKLYCNVKLDASVEADKQRLDLEASRLSFLLALIEMHFKATLRKRFNDRFQYVDLGSPKTRREEPMWMLKGTFKTCLQETLMLVGATRGAIYLGKSTFVEADVKPATEHTVADCVSLDLVKFDEPNRTLIGSLKVCNKRDNTYFSLLDRRMLVELAQTFSKYLSTYQSLGDEAKSYQHQLERQTRLIEISQKISLSLVNASSIDETITALLEGIKSYFSFSALVFLLYDKNKNRLVPYRSLPQSVAAELTKKSFTLNIPNVCALHWKGDQWTINDCPECQKCGGLTTISALRNTPLKIQDIKAPPYKELYADFGVVARSELVLPIRAHDTTYGVLDMYRREAEVIDDNEFYFLKSICSVAALAFYNRNLFELLANIETEENRGEMARDVVHTLTPTTSALKINLQLLENVVNSIGNKPGDKEHVKHELPRVKAQLENLRETIRNQYNLTNRYETMSRRTEEVRGKVNLDKVIDDVIHINTYKAEEKRITIRRNPQGKPRPIRAVEMDVYLIVWNLINNAIKFTRGGKPSTITITEKYTDSEIVLSVRDEGVGIKEQDRSHIWDLGFSTPAPGERDATSGVGLATVKDLVRILGADIQVKSKLNSGSEFTLTIPQKN